MKKSYKLIALFALGFVLTACNSSVNQSTTMHVKDLVQPDVFGVLTQTEQDVLVYQQSDEIEGEYLELAKVEIQNVSKEKAETGIIEKLKEEVKDLGGNGLLITENSAIKDGKTITHEIRAIVVYALDRNPLNKDFANL